MDRSFALAVIADHFAVPIEQVTELSVFSRDLGADSLDLIELSLRLEHEFGVEIGDDESEACPDVGTALRLLGEKLSFLRAGSTGQALG
ncbi:MAG TPA: acyl carrier protein [Sphingomicrobium sp.]|nr:acyl carrier protein [Sphingomicrobium sp.]